MNRRTNSWGNFNTTKLMVESLEPRAYLMGVSFLPYVSYPTGQYPAAVATGDLAGNGLQDIVTANYGAGTVSVLMNNGNGTFAQAVTYPVGNGPDGLAIADLLNNGRGDIIVTNSGTNPADTQNTDANTVSVLYNNGNGTFAPKVDFATGVAPSAVAVADMNGDGLPDLLVANTGGNTVRVLLNDGNGDFTALKDYATGSRPIAVAVADLSNNGKMDVVTANFNSDTVSVLLGNGNGTLQPRVDYATGVFPRSVAIADVTQNGKLDLVVACRGDDTIDVFLGHADGAFEPFVNFASGSSVFSVAVADLNNDGLNDIITADQAAPDVNVLKRTFDHMFVAKIDFLTGQGAESVAVADFNNDGYLDLVTANFNDSTIGVLINNSYTLLYAKSSVRLTSSENPVPSGTAVKLTAHVSGPGGVATGDVTFFDGSTGIGTVPLVNGVASFSATGLSIGVHNLSAYYAGDSKLAPNSSAGLLQLIAPTIPGPDLVATFVSSTLPPEFVIGETASAAFRVINQGTSLASGFIDNELFLSADGTIDGGSIPLQIRGSLSATKVHLKPGQSVLLTGSFTVPANVPVGTYTLLAQINSSNTLAESDTADNTAAAPVTYSAVDEFGDVGGRIDVPLTITDTDGTRDTFRLLNGGVGALPFDVSGTDVLISGATYSTELLITGHGGNGIVQLNNLSSSSYLPSITAPTASISGDVTLPGGITTMTVGGINGATFNIAQGPLATLVFGNVTNTTLISASYITSLTVKSWTGGSISARAINTLVSNGNFSANVAANTIGSIFVRGNVANSIILGGASFGADGMPGGGDDTFVAGTIGSFHVTGSVTDSLVAAGLDVVDDIFPLDGSEILLPGGAIRSIVIGGTADASSKFVVAVPPSKAKIGGAAVTTATDPRFHL